LAETGPVDIARENAGEISHVQPLYTHPSEQTDPRLIEWGYADTEEAIIDLGRLLKDRDAFDGLAATPEPMAFRPITMQDVRLAAGEGPLRPEDVLAGCNAELQRRARLFVSKQLAHLSDLSDTLNEASDLRRQVKKQVEAEAEKIKAA
jgi:hypothetical protein